MNAVTTTRTPGTGRGGMFEEFLDWYDSKSVRTKGAPMAPRTREAKGYRLRAVAKMLGADSPMSLAAQLSSRERVSTLFDMLYLRQKPGTVLSTALALRHFGEYAVVAGFIGAHHVLDSDIPQRAPRQKPIEVYSHDEVEKLLLYARVKDLRFWMFLVTLADTGRRSAEILGMTWDDLHLEAQPPYINLPTTKNGRQQFVPLSSRLVRDVFSDEHVAKLKAKGHPLWKKDIQVTPFPWKYQAAHGTLRQLCEAAEIPFRNGFHIFRHTYATRQIARGVPMQAVSALLGHSNIGTTDRLYNHATTLDYARYVD